MHYECKQCLKPYQYCECKKESEVNELQETKAWFEQAIPEPDIKTACIQIGCAYEETGELALTLGDEPMDAVVNDAAASYKNCHQDVVAHLSKLDKYQKIQMLDDIVDEIVTRVGIAHNMGFDILGALAEVNRSNFSKFEGGKPVFDKNGKITKGKHYTPPQLDKFI